MNELQIQGAFIAASYYNLNNLSFICSVKNEKEITVLKPEYPKNNFVMLTLPYFNVKKDKISVIYNDLEQIYKNFIGKYNYTIIGTKFNDDGTENCTIITTFEHFDIFIGFCNYFTACGIYPYELVILNKKNINGVNQLLHHNLENNIVLDNPISNIYPNIPIAPHILTVSFNVFAGHIMFKSINSSGYTIDELKQDLQDKFEIDVKALIFIAINSEIPHFIISDL